jgi:hypothetical protein
VGEDGLDEEPGHESKGSSLVSLLLLDGESFLRCREEIFPNVDLSRTVGWFISVFPSSSIPAAAPARGCAAAHQGAGQERASQRDRL